MWSKGCTKGPARKGCPQKVSEDTAKGRTLSQSGYAKAGVQTIRVGSKGPIFVDISRVADRLKTEGVLYFDFSRD